jgi:hypothetical protein
VRACTWQCTGQGAGKPHTVQTDMLVQPDSVGRGKTGRRNLGHRKHGDLPKRVASSEEVTSAVGGLTLEDTRSSTKRLGEGATGLAMRLYLGMWRGMRRVEWAARWMRSWWSWHVALRSVSLSCSLSHTGSCELAGEDATADDIANSWQSVAISWSRRVQSRCRLGGRCCGWEGKEGAGVSMVKLGRTNHSSKQAPGAQNSNTPAVRYETICNHSHASTRRAAKAFSNASANCSLRVASPHSCNGFLSYDCRCCRSLRTGNRSLSCVKAPQE